MKEELREEQWGFQEKEWRIIRSKVKYGHLKSLHEMVETKKIVTMTLTNIWEEGGGEGNVLVLQSLFLIKLSISLPWCNQWDY